MPKDDFDIPQIKPKEEPLTPPNPDPGIDMPQIKPHTIDATNEQPMMASETTMETNNNNTQLDNKPRFSFKKPALNLGNIKMNRKSLGIAGGVFAVILILMIVFVAIPGINLYNKGQVLAAQAQVLQDAAKSQDLAKMKSELATFKTQLQDFDGSLGAFGWTGGLPLVGPYYRDAEAGVTAGLHGIDAAEILMVTVEPYADIIGLTGNTTTAKSGEENANDRIEFIIQTIGQISPKLDEISAKAELARAELQKIDPARYPEEFQGKKIRENLQEVLTLADEATAVISEGKPLLQMAPYFLGIDEPRTYLVLFQNDKELRATGGFLTAYSIMTVNKGKFTPVSSSDMYSLDAKYRPSVPADPNFRAYIKGPYGIQRNFYLRDLNWNPDFKESMTTFTTELEKISGVPEFDGIIAVDTHVVVKILKVLGQIGVPGFGNFSAENDPRCDCPNVVYELEEFADVEGPVVWDPNTGEIVFAPKNYGKNRKEIVGPLMNSVLSNALGQPMEKMPDLFQAGWESLTEKHVLFYMFDEKAQAAVEAFNIGGAMQDFEGDYFHLSNVNLGGRKSNLYVTHEVSQEVTKASDGSVEKTVTITYKNPQSYDGWLNSVLPNWTRVYVPEGSQLISMDGFADKIDPYTENGKTVFAGGFELRPEGVARVTIKYKLPFKVQNRDYRILVQKQPGTDNPLYTFTVGRTEEEAFLLTDKEFRFSL